MARVFPPSSDRHCWRCLVDSAIPFCLMHAIPGRLWDEMMVTGALYTIGSVRGDA
ncbi:MAG: hypothetical protein NT075_18880 [Chloroflexi bacterium]|nr:hypothetical protein [Chloroflexota bacterium]